MNLKEKKATHQSSAVSLRLFRQLRYGDATCFVDGKQKDLHGSLLRGASQNAFERGARFREREKESEGGREGGREQFEPRRERLPARRGSSAVGRPRMFIF